MQEMHTIPVRGGLYGGSTQPIIEWACMRLCTTPCEREFAYGLYANPSEKGLGWVLHTSPFGRGFAWELHVIPLEEGFHEDCTQPSMEGRLHATPLSGGFL